VVGGVPPFANQLRLERDAAVQQASQAEARAEFESRAHMETNSEYEASLQRQLEGGDQRFSNGWDAAMDSCREDVDRAQAGEERARREKDDAEDEVEELEREVAVVRAREEALKGVIERMIERYGQQVAQGVDRVDE